MVIIQGISFREFKVGQYYLFNNIKAKIVEVNKDHINVILEGDTHPRKIDEMHYHRLNFYWKELNDCSKDIRSYYLDMESFNDENSLINVTLEVTPYYKNYKCACIFSIKRGYPRGYATFTCTDLHFEANNSDQAKTFALDFLRSTFNLDNF